MINLKDFKRDVKTGAIINTSNKKTLEHRVAQLEREIEELRLLIKGEENGKIRTGQHNWTDERQNQ